MTTATHSADLRVPTPRLRNANCAEHLPGQGSERGEGLRLATTDLPRPDARVPTFSVSWAVRQDEIAEAQRLRYRIFAGELGAKLNPPADAPPQHDVDEFDAFCNHLLVRAHTGSQIGKVVATCRLMTPEGAEGAGGLYTAGEFDLHPISSLLPRVIEMGRVCIEPEWRNGLLVMAMWRAIGERMAVQNLQTMIGCASVGLSDGGELAAQLWRRLKSTHMVPATQQVRPRSALVLSSIGANAIGEMPTLMKGYLRCGGKLLGPPAIDPAFNTADFPMIVNLGDLPNRYTKRVFSAAR